MRLIILLIFLLAPTISFCQFRLKYGAMNWNLGGSFNAPNFRQFIDTYNAIGPKPPGVSSYGFRIRPFGANTYSITTGFGVDKGPVLLTLSYDGGRVTIDDFGDGRSVKNWRKSLNYDYDGIGVGLMFHLFKSNNENSVGFPRIEYQIGLNRETDVFRYGDDSGISHSYKTHNLAVSSFIQYNFYAPFLGDGPTRFVWGINLRYHKNLNPVDFSALPNDLGISYNHDLSETFRDLTIGFTLGMLTYGTARESRGHKGNSGFTNYSTHKATVSDYDRYRFNINPKRVLELRAIDSATLQTVNATFDVFDEYHKVKVPILYDKFIPRSVFYKTPVVNITAHARGYYTKDLKLQLEGLDTLKIVADVKMVKMPGTPVGILYFEKSSLEMSADYSAKIDSVVSVLNQHPEMSVAVEGHTSRDGSSELNTKLSFERADLIRRMLIRHGVDARRITVQGLGSTRPAVVKDSEDQQRMNRRVEILLR